MSLKKTVIVVIDHDAPVRLDDRIQGLIDIGHIGCYSYGKFRILKVAIRDTMFLETSSLTRVALLVFSVHTKSVLKNRFGINDLPTSLYSLPAALQTVFNPVVDLLWNDLSIDELKQKYSNNNLLHAIYLTNNYDKFKDSFDIMELQFIRYKYGKEVPKDLITQVVDLYPEKII